MVYLISLPSTGTSKRICFNYTLTKLTPFLTTFTGTNISYKRVTTTTKKMTKNPMQCQLANRLCYYDFNNPGKFIIMEQLRNIQTTSTVTLKERLKQEKNLCFMKLETLAPHDLNQDLNWGNVIQSFCSLTLSFIFAYGLKYDVSRKMTWNILQYL